MLVSIVIPCYNVANCVAESIDSALEQSYSDIEIICVDNCSTDSTLSILKEYEYRYSTKIKVLIENKKGASAARNKGLSVARGEWIQFLDADDLLDPLKLQHQISLVNSNQQIDFLVSSFYKLSTTGIKTLIHLNQQDPFKALFISKLGITSSNLFRRNSIINVGGWDENLKSSQEASLMFKLLASGGVAIFDDLPKTIIRERNEGQISQLDPNNNWVQYVNLRLEILNFLKNSKTSYFEKEKEFYYSNLFKQIRRIAKFDLVGAESIFKIYFPNDFKPNVGIFYSLCFKLLGFKFTEKLFQKSII